ncbi:KpsF/GutQ family sugar-phosphate isomerase [Succinivibrio dextrinosolvens]|uniref:KpsF/GutQ family sugar-phosphate isomerase n=1 Tax=Succinivibrio dextrinosolvens TaxID=83771 RepID=UPI001923ADD7|nr:KpsF/GutQ family sugar-phosphate isomerase [Succinivibrio dextrinosolvens]
MTAKFEKDRLNAYKTVNAEIDTLYKLRDSIDETLTIALDQIEKTQGRLIVTGIGKSGHIGKKIAASLASTGTSSFFVHPAEASHGDLGMITGKDTVLAISNSGEAKELSDILNYCKRYSIPIIGMTKNKNSMLGKACDILLRLPDNGEAGSLGLAPTNSTTATLVWGDILTVALMERKGFSKEEFNSRHPGGKLGAVLKRVSAVMHKGDEIPLLSADASFEDLVKKMFQSHFCIVGFTNENGGFIGTIDELSLSKEISSYFLSKTSTEIKVLLNTSPVTIKENMMVSECLKILKDNKLTAVFVVENNVPVGIVSIQDLLRNDVI